MAKRTSSVIKSTEHLEVVVNVLDVELKNGSVYRYFGVPKKVASQFEKAESKGKFFVEKIKNNYAFEQLK